MKRRRLEAPNRPPAIDEEILARRRPVALVQQPGKIAGGWHHAASLANSSGSICAGAREAFAFRGAARLRFAAFRTAGTA